MQPFVTPHPGRTPRENASTIIDTDHYKLKVELSKLTGDNWQLEIIRWIPETGCSRLELFLSTDELKKVQKAILT